MVTSKMGKFAYALHVCMSILYIFLKEVSASRTKYHFYLEKSKIENLHVDTKDGPYIRQKLIEYLQIYSLDALISINSFW